MQRITNNCDFFSSGVLTGPSAPACAPESLFNIDAVHLFRCPSSFFRVGLFNLEDADGTTVIAYIEISAVKADMSGIGNHAVFGILATDKVPHEL